MVTISAAAASLVPPPDHHVQGVVRDKETGVAARLGLSLVQKTKPVFIKPSRAITEHGTTEDVRVATSLRTRTRKGEG